MKEPGPMYYYLFKGDWLDRFNELDEMSSKDKIQGFELWVPSNKSRNHHLIITYGKPLTKTYCLVKMVWKTSEEIFQSYYGQNKEDFTVHKGTSGERTSNNSVTSKTAFVL